MKRVILFFAMLLAMLLSGCAAGSGNQSTFAFVSIGKASIGGTTVVSSNNDAVGIVRELHR